MKELTDLIKKYWIGIACSILTMIILNLAFGSVCASTILIGVPCPACGITRATLLMLTGHMKESLQMHPLLLLVILGLIGYPIVKKRLKNYINYIKLYVIICSVIFIGYYIYRMVLYYPNVEPLVYNPDNYFHRIATLTNMLILRGRFFLWNA